MKKSNTSVSAVQGTAAANQSQSAPATSAPAKAAETKVEKKETKSVSSVDKVKFFQPLIAEGKYTAAELLKMAQDHFPKLTESTIRTFITDSKNPKYNKFEKLVIVDAEKKVLKFAA
jgi:hypothetical protein